LNKRYITPENQAQSQSRVGIVSSKKSAYQFEYLKMLSVCLAFFLVFREGESLRIEKFSDALSLSLRAWCGIHQRQAAC
jgi:hypothetical protein